MKFSYFHVASEFPLGSPFEPNEPGKRVHSPDPVADFVAAETPLLTQLGAQLTALTTGIANLDQIIQSFDNSPGTLSPSDQAALNQIIAASTALNTQAQAISTAAPPAAASPAPQS